MALRPRLLALASVFVLAAGLSGCALPTPGEELSQTKPSGSAFSKALFADYSALARSLGLADVPRSVAFDADSSWSLTDIAPDVSDTAVAYAHKAMAAGRGEEPLPEEVPGNDETIEAARRGLLRMLVNGRTVAPVEAARTQAQFDCWMLDLPVPELQRAAQACHRAFLADLAHLNTIPAVTAPPPEPKAEPQQGDDEGE